MEPILILLVTVAGVSHAFLPAAETQCNATQNASVCSATVGGTVHIQLMTNASGHQLRCKKQLSSGLGNVFHLKKEKVMIYEPFRNRTEFLINTGTLKITHLERNDSGHYTTGVFDSNGVLVKEIHFKLDVQENKNNILKIWIPVACAVGALLLIVCCCVCCCAVRRRKKKKKKKKKKSGK